MTTSFADDGARSDGKLDVGDLCRMFEESEGSTYNARILSERDRDYYDGKQLTEQVERALKSRGQPPVVDNIIKTKIDYLDGVEKQQRIDPKVLPRTPKHEADADGATEALRYVAQQQDYDKKRSAVWRNLLIEGCGGISVSVKPGKEYGGQQGFEVEVKRIAWDRLFFDPHSSEPDFSDAGYLGVVTWMNYDDAIAIYPNSKAALDTTLDSSPSQTYDDKPKFSLWADKKRKRVRICQIWIKRNKSWFFAEYTKGGILKSGASPYVTDTGESDCELIFQSAYVDRDNNRYGFVRELISLQDEVNKRRSKSLHLLSVNQLHYETGAVADVQRARREMNKPDGVVEYAPGMLENKRVLHINGIELATAQFQLLQEAKNAIDLKGPNATEMGDKTQGSNAASGRAIIASQQGGMTQLSHLTDRLQDLDIRVFRAIWSRIRQFWRAEKWIRVTDDEQNIKWVGINADPQRVQFAMAQNPEMQNRIASVVGSVAELDCDIIIDEAPDSLTPQLEQFQAMVELKKFDAGNEIPFKSIVRASPNLKAKQQILNDIQQREQQQAAEQQPLKQLQYRGAAAEVQNKEADTAGKMAGAEHQHAQAVKTMQEASLAPERHAKEMQQERAPA